MPTHVDTIDVLGVNGDFCRISPPGFSWGPELAPGSTGLFDMPIQTNWGSYGFGQFYQSWKPKRRDVVWTVHIINPDTGGYLTHDEYLWHLIYCRWRAMFAPDKEAIVLYTGLDGERRLGLRNVQAPQSFSSQNFEGKDPKIFRYGSIVQTQAAELPFYVGKSDRFEIEFEGAGDHWGTLPYFNPSTVDIWAEWDASWGAKWVFPDYSYGNDVYGRGPADEGKTVPTPQLLESDGNVTIFTRPDKETYISERETPVGLRAAGKDFEYPLPPGAGSSDPEGPNAGCVVRALGVTDTAAAIVTLPRWYETPFSTPLVV